MKSIIRFFSSVKLAIFLLIIITLATILGTLIPQEGSPKVYIEKYGDWGSILRDLGITRLYRSSWYLALLVLFSINIITCSLTRIKQKFTKAFKPQVITQEKNFSALSFKHTSISHQSLPQARKALRAILRSKGYRVREKSGQNQIYLLARKRFLGWFGSDAVHFGILIVMIGGFISGAFGFRDNLALLEEETKPVPRANFSLKLNQFETIYYKDGSVKDWKSTLSVIEKNQAVLTKTIEVNHPLSYRGCRFYQSGYGWDWRNPLVEILIEIKTGNPFSESIQIKVGEKTFIKDKNIEINALYFVPDFVITDENKVTTRSLEPNNPAIFVKAKENGEDVFSGWLFLKYPEFKSRNSQKDSDLSLRFKDFKAEPYSVIQIAKDPGVLFIWVGCCFVMIGLSLAFYYIPKEIKIMIKKENGLTKIYAGGTMKKAAHAFKEEFDKIIHSFRKIK
ncbi:MAG: cytochrome c biogenesis protein ResB [Acidobacteriota bacterium]